MTVAQQRILRERRQYNQWVANETLEDYALRFTASKARKRSAFRVANTALGTVAFLVLEAVGATITLSYGFTNAVAAILVVGAIIFALGLPVSYYAAKYGVDIDLLTRGAGFGYIGSTITSLIYASFTFIFFALEAAIMSLALEMSFGVPLVWGYLISALVVIPLVTHGFTFLSRFQFWTQILWVVLQLVPFIYIGVSGVQSLHTWTSFAGRLGPADGHFDFLLFGAASSVVFALVAQNAEQVDFLRFLPRQRKGRRFGWWAAVICAGPGWVVPGIIKMLVGSFLAVVLVKTGLSFERAAQPTQMYLFAFQQALHNPQIAIALTGIFVVVSQLKINVTNAYAGSLAWSNFFSRLTHSHPGRVVWLVFNVTLALLLMEMGIYQALERTLGLYSNIPVAWMAVIAADLAINKPLGLSPRHIEFKRAYLYNINPVGVGSMVIASAAAIATHAGAFGQDYRWLAPFVALIISFLLVPLIAWATKGRYYSARPRQNLTPGENGEIRCCICEHSFEPEDMAGCPVYSGPICSLCCSLDARCHDACKEGTSFAGQWNGVLGMLLPGLSITRPGGARLVKYFSLLLLCSGIAAGLLSIIYVHMTSTPGADMVQIGSALRNVFCVLEVVVAIAIWPFLLAKESSLAARQESAHQTTMLFEEIEAHRRTDLELQRAKELADARSLAKSKYVRGISHELRTPLNAVLGYAQLLEANQSLPAPLKRSVQVIRRSGGHLSSLVDGLLDISMIEAGRLQIFRDEVVLADFFGPLIDMLSLQAEEKGLTFTFIPPAHLPDSVYTDEKRLKQILINLLSNAIRCTRSGGVTLRMTYSSQVARFDIIDTGIGIAEQDLQRIFQPFERIDNPAHPSKGGTGLGLTITKLLVEAMGGEITVQSTPGKGSCFTVRLLLSSVFSAKRAPEAPRLPITGYHGPRRSILIVDDDPNHVAFVREALTPLGFLVVSEESGMGCLDAAAQCNPDAILLDISMPDMDGWEVARSLREETQIASRIIMISADARQESQRISAAAHHDAYLMKPLQLSTLFETLKNLLHLEWRYDAIVHTAPVELNLRALDAGQIPPAEQLVSLRYLGQIGHVRGILSKLDEVSQTYPSTAPVVSYLRDLAESCDLERYGDTLEALSSDER
jgi:signal transduction histidine kinase/CheY-like chemotaxis protein